MRINDLDCLDNDIVAYRYTAPSSDIIELAYLSGQLSRFCVDSWLPPGSFKDLYKAWITKILAQIPLTSVYACYQDGSAIGMITSQCIGDVCSIGLLAVHPSFQGEALVHGLLSKLRVNV